MSRRGAREESFLFDPPPNSLVIVPEPSPGFSIADLRPPTQIQIIRSCRQADEVEEIIVCGQRDQSRYRLRASGPPSRSFNDDLANALTFKLGPIEIGPGPFQGAQSTGNGFGFRIRF